MQKLCRVSVMVRTMNQERLFSQAAEGRLWRMGAWVVVVLAAVFAAGCATRSGGTRPDRDGAPMSPPADLASTPDPEPQIEPIRQGGPNKPYVVLGQAYEPMASDVVWREKGVASWYGTKFHGRKTASGELFSMYGVTAAHRTLPIPSYARVRNVGNGKEIIVRVNDRGPFHSSRVMDLSYAAAVKLGIASAGSAVVEIERLTFDDIRSGSWRKQPELGAPATEAVAALPEQAMPAPEAVAPPAASEERVKAYTPAAQGYWVQLAALSRREGVDRLQQRVNSEAASLAPMMAVFKEAAVYKLQVGPYASRQEAQDAARTVKEALQLVPLVIERR